MPAHALTAHNDIIDDINGLWLGSSFLDRNDLQMKLMFKRVEAVKKIDPVEGWALAGILESVVGDRERSDYAFQNAFRIGGQNAHVVGNWFASLCNLGLFSHGQALFAEWGQPRFHFLATMIQEAMTAGALQALAEFMAEGERKFHMEFDPRYSEQVSRMAKLTQEMGITDKDVAAHLEAAGDVLHRHGFATKVVNTLMDVDEHALIYQICVGHDADIFGLNLELAAEQFARGLKATPNFDVVVAE